MPSITNDFIGHCPDISSLHPSIRTTMALVISLASPALVLPPFLGSSPNWTLVNQLILPRTCSGCSCFPCACFFFGGQTHFCLPLGWSMVAATLSNGSWEGQADKELLELPLLSFALVQIGFKKFYLICNLNNHLNFLTNTAIRDLPGGRRELWLVSCFFLYPPNTSNHQHALAGTSPSTVQPHLAQPGPLDQDKIIFLKYTVESLE